MVSEFFPELSSLPLSLPPSSSLPVAVQLYEYPFEVVPFSESVYLSLESPLDE